MRLPKLLLLLFVSPATLLAQPLPEWYRVYTFDESKIELNTAVITPISQDVTRVRFRWVFDQPQQLAGIAQRYQSRLEVMELNCELKSYRPYHFTYFDAAGNTILIQDSPGEWGRLVSGSMMEKLFLPACALINKKVRGVTKPAEPDLSDRVAHFSYEFAKLLAQTKDFKSAADQYFVADYLDRYLRDEKKNWFLNLNRDTATTVSKQELQRFYVAMMNTNYLSSSYLIRELMPYDEDPPPDKLLPPDVLRLIRSHPYTTRYQVREGDYYFLGDSVDDPERLRSYTDLLERINSLFRKNLNRVKVASTSEWSAIQEDWGFYHPRLRLCSDNCLGLPRGTKIFTVEVPTFRLEIAEIEGKLKVISAMSSALR